METLNQTQASPPSQKVFKVVVAVDVQNCFLFASEEENANDLNLNSKGDNPTIETSKQVTKEISELVQQIQPDACVFTRDLHPMNHLSFKDDEGRIAQPGITWPRHCRNQTTRCESRIGNTEKTDNKSAPAPPKSLNDVVDSKTQGFFGNSIVNIIDGIKKSNYVLNLNESNTEHTEIINEVEKLYADVYNSDNNSNQKNTTNVVERFSQIFNKSNKLQKSLLTLLAKLKIRGNEISYLFYSTPLVIPCLMLNMGNKLGKYKIGLEETRNELDTNNTLDLKDGTYGQIAQPENYFEFNVNDKKTKFVALTKGERCDQESYSAFNYHVAYELDPVDKKTVTMVDAPAFDEKNSTGLWEWILSNKGGEEVKDIEIYVCGLVGNVCVIQSVLQGMAIWKHYYQANNPKISVQFKFSLLGTRFTGALAPKIIDPYKVGTSCIPINDIIKAHFPKWIKDLTDIDQFANIVAKDGLDGYNFKVYTGNNDEIEINLNNPAPAASLPAGGKKRRTRKIKYCKICKGCCKKTHAKNRRNLRKTRR
jgi:hypothetical protein